MGDQRVEQCNALEDLLLVPGLCQLIYAHLDADGRAALHKVSQSIRGQVRASVANPGHIPDLSLIWSFALPPLPLPHFLGAG
jgi:hypothetical protein